MNLVELKTKKFAQYKETITNMINAEAAEDQTRIKAILKQKADIAKNTERDVNIHKPAPMYPLGPPGATEAADSLLKNGVVLSSGGAVVPKDWQHYATCSCYVADARFPAPTLELAELEMLSEAEARSELARLATLVRKQRIMHRTRDMLSASRYQNKINTLTKQLNNNSYLWEQLGEAEKRERVVKQELLISQQNLVNAEKSIALL